MPVTYTPPDGTTIDLDDGTDNRFLGLAGRGAPVGLTVETRIPYGPGSTIHRVDLQPRDVRLDLRISADTFAALDARMAMLAADMAASQGGSAPREGVLELTDFGGIVRRLRCLPVGGLDWPGERSGITIPASLTFRAAHPFWYGGGEVQRQVQIGQPGSLAFPWTFPIAFGRDQPSGEATVMYGGTAWSRSLSWTVPGPVRAPALANVTTDQGLAFADSFVVPEGLRLSVRMGWSPADARTDLRAWIEDAGGGRTSVIGDLASNVRPIELTPGANFLVASQAEERTPPTVHALSYWTEYLAA